MATINCTNEECCHNKNGEDCLVDELDLSACGEGALMCDSYAPWPTKAEYNAP
jgi:hypothetical protein